jgi:hypothetical protein
MGKERRDIRPMVRVMTHRVWPRGACQTTPSFPPGSLALSGEMLCTTRRLAHASRRRAFSAQPSLAHPYVFHNLRGTRPASATSCALTLPPSLPVRCVSGGCSKSPFALRFCFPKEGSSPVYALLDVPECWLLARRQARSFAARVLSWLDPRR